MACVAAERNLDMLSTAPYARREPRGSEPGRAAAEVLCQPDALPARYMSERRLDRNSMRSADR